MAEDLFKRGDIFAVLQKMGSVAVPQGMDSGRFADVALSYGYPEGGLDGADVDMLSPEGNKYSLLMPKSR